MAQTKTILWVLVFVLLAMMPAFAADFGIGFKGFKLSLSENNFTPRPMKMAGTLGLRLTPNLELQGETFSSRTDAAGGRDLYMMNLRYEVDLRQGGKRLTPFFMAGAGMAYNSVYNNFSNDTQSGNVAWQLGGGLQYDLKENMALTGSYRYFDAGILKSYNNGITAAGGHELFLGLKYKFPAQ